MARYRYRALSSGGALLRGERDGASAAEITAYLQKSGAMVLAVSPAARGLGLLSLELGGAGALRRTELADATRELASMLGAGQDLDRALRFMVEEPPNKRVGTVLGRVRDLVRNGAPLATALQKEPKSFTRLYIGLVRAGEAGGDLSGTLERLAGLLERQRAMTATIQSAMIYPAILLVAATGSIVLLLTQVLPQFVPLFAQNGVALPPSTAFLLGAGHAVSAYGPYALVILGAHGFAAHLALRKPAPRLAADRLLLRLPLIGGLIREILAAIEAGANAFVLKRSIATDLLPTIDAVLVSGVT